jgi:hypothetical protein
MTGERRLGAREAEEIFTAFAEAMRELPPDVEAGWLDAEGNLPSLPTLLASCAPHDAFANCCGNGGSASAKAESSAPVRPGDDAFVVQPADLGR